MQILAANHVWGGSLRGLTLNGSCLCGWQVDKPDAAPDRVKQELADIGVMPEEWGGSIPMVPVSPLHHPTRLLCETAVCLQNLCRAIIAGMQVEGDWMCAATGLPLQRFSAYRRCVMRLMGRVC